MQSRDTQHEQTESFLWTVLVHSVFYSVFIIIIIINMICVCQQRIKEEVMLPKTTKRVRESPAQEPEKVTSKRLKTQVSRRRSCDPLSTPLIFSLVQVQVCPSLEPAHEQGFKYEFGLWSVFRIHRAPAQRGRLRWRRRARQKAAALRMTAAVTPKILIRTTAAPLPAFPALNRATRATRTHPPSPPASR